MNTLKVLFKQNLEPHSMNDDSEISGSSISKQVNSKEEFKSLTKYVIQLFNRVKCEKDIL